MKPSAIFDLVIKCVGLLFLVRTIDAASACIALQNMKMGSNAQLGSVVVNLFIFAGLTIWFLFGAPPIQNVAYPAKPRTSARPNSGTPAGTNVTHDGPACVSCDKPVPVGAKTCPACGWAQPDAR